MRHHWESAQHRATGAAAAVAGDSIGDQVLVHIAACRKKIMSAVASFIRKDLKTYSRMASDILSTYTETTEWSQISKDVLRKKKSSWSNNWQSQVNLPSPVFVICRMLSYFITVKHYDWIAAV